MFTQMNVLLKNTADGLVHSIPGLRRLALAVARSIHNAAIKNHTTRYTADALHGTWLGHPLHPVLTDVTIGAWSFAAVFDGMSLLNKADSVRRAADNLITIGTVSAVPTALAGFTDYSAIKRNASEYGMMHGLLNSVGLLVYIASWRARRKEERVRAISLSTFGFSLLTVSAWLGGELVYRLRVGVNHSQEPTQPENWITVMSASDLHESEHRRVEIEGNPVLLYRYGGTIYAIGSVCSHAGGPLEEGTFDGYCVTCPWHDSVFDVRDGTLVHGPTTYNQPRYRARIRNGQIELITDSAHKKLSYEQSQQEERQMSVYGSG